MTVFNSFDLQNERKIEIITRILEFWAQSGWVELFIASLIIFITTTAILFIQKNPKKHDDKNGNSDDKSGELSTPPESDETKNKLPRQYRRVSFALLKYTVNF